MSSDGFIIATSSEGLQALGSAAQRSFELVAETVRSHLGEDPALIFAEPITTERGARIEWYAPCSGEVIALERLPAAEVEGVRAALERHRAAISGLAETVAARKTPEGFWLAEALRNALTVPAEGSIWALRDTGGGLRPLLINWARQGEALAHVRGVLTGLAPSTSSGQALLPAPPSTPHATALIASAFSVTRVEPFPPWWIGWLLGLGWLALAAMISALIWLMIAPCGLNPFGPGGCDEKAAGQSALRGDVQAQIAALEDNLASKTQDCDLAGTTTADTTPAIPFAPEGSVIPPPASHSETGIQPDEVDRRLQNRALTPGADLTFSVVWNGFDDLDMRLECPKGSVSFRELRSAECRAVLDVDANFPSEKAVEDPVENISVTDPAVGRYVVFVRRSIDRPPAGQINFELIIRQGGEITQNVGGSISTQMKEWAYEIEVAAP